MTNKPHTKLLTYNDDIHNMLTKMQEFYGGIPASTVFQLSLVALYKKEFPPYVMEKKERAKITPEDRAKATFKVQEEREALKAQAILDKQMAYVTDLEGTIELTNGIKHCRYQIYEIGPGNKVDSIDMVEPLDYLNDASVQNQYRDMFNKTGPEVKERVKQLLTANTK